MIGDVSQKSKLHQDKIELGMKLLQRNMALEEENRRLRSVQANFKVMNVHYGPLVAQFWEQGMTTAGIYKTLREIDDSENSNLHLVLAEQLAEDVGMLKRLGLKTTKESVLKILEGDDSFPKSSLNEKAKQVDNASIESLADAKEEFVATSDVETELDMKHESGNRVGDELGVDPRVQSKEKQDIEPKLRKEGAWGFATESGSGDVNMRGVTGGGDGSPGEMVGEEVAQSATKKEHKSELSEEACGYATVIDGDDAWSKNSEVLAGTKVHDGARGGEGTSGKTLELEVLDGNDDEAAHVSSNGGDITLGESFGVDQPAQSKKGQVTEATGHQMEIGGEIVSKVGDSFKPDDGVAFGSDEWGKNVSSAASREYATHTSVGLEAGRSVDNSSGMESQCEEAGRLDKKKDNHGHHKVDERVDNRAVAKQTVVKANYWLIA